MSNYRYFEKGLEFQFMAVIPGYRLHAMKDYPYAVWTGLASELLTVEVFRVIDPVVERAIHELEKEVGYVYDEVVLHGHRVGIYLYEKAGGEPLVESGDWIKFFGS